MGPAQAAQRIGLGKLVFPVGDNPILQKIDQESRTSSGAIDQADLKATGMSLDDLIGRVSSGKMLMFYRADQCDVQNMPDDARMWERHGRQLRAMHERLLSLRYVGKAFPLGRVKTDTGRTVDLNVFRGKKKIIVHRWATYCSPCLTEFPALAEFYRRNADRIILVLLSADERSKRPMAIDMVRQNFSGLAPVSAFVAENAQLQKATALQALPTTFVIDVRGKIQTVIDGSFDWEQHGAILFPE